MQRHQWGAVVIIILTIVLTVLVYAVTFNINLAKDELEQTIARQIKQLDNLSLHDNDLIPEVCEGEVFRGTCVVLFRMREKHEWNGIIVLTKGFNQRWRLRELFFGKNIGVSNTILRAGGQRSIILYGAGFKGEASTVELFDERQNKSIYYTKPISRDFFLQRIDQDKKNLLWEFYLKQGKLPQSKILDKQGFSCYTYGDEQLAIANLWHVHEVYSGSSTLWAIIVIIVGALLAVEQWQYDKLHKSYLVQSKSSRALSKLLNKYPKYLKYQ